MSGKLVAAQIILKLIQTSEMLTICRLMFFLWHTTGKKKEKGIYKKNAKSLYKNTVFLPGSRSAIKFLNCEAMNGILAAHCILSSMNVCIFYLTSTHCSIFTMQISL